MTRIGKRTEPIRRVVVGAWLLFVVPVAALSQTDSLDLMTKAARGSSNVFAGGTLDILQGGQMNASARLFQLYLGKPGGRRLPLSISTGVMAGALAGYPLHDEGVSLLVNPAGGLLNMRVEGDRRLTGDGNLRVQLQGAVRLLNLFDPAAFVNYRFVNALAGGGLIWMTAAWEEGREKDPGICWCSLRLFGSAAPEWLFSDYLQTRFFPVLLGVAAGVGVDISQRLQVRTSYFRFCNTRGEAVFREPVIQLSFSYQGG